MTSPHDKAGAPREEAPAPDSAATTTATVITTADVHGSGEAGRNLGSAATCEICDRPPEPCRCALTPCYDPDHDADDALGHDCDTEKAIERCRHRGPLLTFRRDVFAHLDCPPAGWVPEVAE